LSKKIVYGNAGIFFKGVRVMAGFFSDELLSEIISANDIVDIVSGYVRLKRSGNSYMGCCPFHREKTPSFHVSADKQLYHCFGCGVGGSVIQFIMNAESLDFHDAVRFLADRVNIRLPEDDGTAPSEERHRRKQQIYAMNKDAARFFRDYLLSEKGAFAREYFTKRGLSGKTIAAFGLGLSPDGWDGLLKHLEKKGYERGLITEAGLCIHNEKGHTYDRFRARVMFPIIDVRGNITGFGGRILSGDGAKYMNSPESIVYDKGKTLFALNLAKKSKRGYFILVEGYMDVISLHQAGIDAAVAGCGTALTREQARLLCKSPVYLCYDSDEAGIKACERAAEIFSEFDTKLRVIAIPGCKDADEFIKKYGATEFEKLIEKAKTVTEHRLDMLLKGADLNDVSQKIEIINKAAKIFAGLKSDVEREIYINQLSVKSGISIDAINSEVRKINGKNVRREVSTELKKAVASPGSAGGQKNTRRISAEAGFLAMLSESKKVFTELGGKFTPEDFSGVHKIIFENILAFYRAEEGGFCSDYLMAKMHGMEKEVSAVIMNTFNIGDAFLAAKDFSAVLEDEIFSDELKKAQEDGNIALISELLKQKKQRG